MNNKTVTWLLKAVLIVSACAILITAVNLLPMYMRHVVEVMPELSGWYGWIIAYGWLLAIPALLALALMWLVFDTIAAGGAFCEKNAVRFTRVWQLALFDEAWVIVMAVFLWVNRIMPPFIVVTVLGLLFFGVAAGVTCFALSGLVRNAARLREENEMTI